MTASNVSAAQIIDDVPQEKSKIQKDYDELNEKCDKVLNRIKKRKGTKNGQKIQSR